MRRAKVICTIGPACNDEDSLRNLILSGMDIARINTSHSDEKEVRDVVGKIRKIAREYHKNTAIMLDLQGPKIRVGELDNDLILGRDEIVYFTYEEKDINKVQGQIIKVDYSKFVDDVIEGLSIFIDDGLIECKVLKKDKNLVKCKVLRGGILKPNKGINLPGVRITIDSVTEKDIYFLKLGIDLEVDFIAQSFVRSFEDVSSIKKIIKKNNSHQMVIAKIEKHEAVNQFEEILKEADGIMVARGDLGIEIDEEDVPILQKEIIKKSNKLGKPVITATQMLDSMIRNPRPTRAEVSDVANAILDGSDAIMLSGETAIGKYPLESLEMMIKIINKTETSQHYNPIFQKREELMENTITRAISAAACEVAYKINAKTIISSTQSGHTARQVSRNRPDSIIIGASPYEYVVRQLMVSWGVIPLKTKFAGNIEEIIQEAIDATKENKYIKNGDTVVITAGILVNKPGSTNFINVKEVGS